jgi:hypothetical protein
MLPLGPGGCLHGRPGGPAIWPSRHACRAMAGREHAHGHPSARARPGRHDAEPRREAGLLGRGPGGAGRDRDAADRGRGPEQRQLPARPSVPRAVPRRRPGEPAHRRRLPAGREPAPAWRNRYATRLPTQPERIAADQIRNRDIVESGHAGPGIDGAHYSRAYYPQRSPRTASSTMGVLPACSRAPTSPALPAPRSAARWPPPRRRSSSRKTRATARGRSSLQHRHRHQSRREILARRKPWRQGRRCSSPGRSPVPVVPWCRDYRRADRARTHREYVRRARETLPGSPSLVGFFRSR